MYNIDHLRYPYNHFIQNCDEVDVYLLHTVGTKGAKKVLAKLAKGAVKNEGKVWFHELSDKGKFIITIMQIMICYPFNQPSIHSN